jgi:hypothetical protein
VLKGVVDEVIQELVEVFALLMDLLDFKHAAQEALYAVWGARGQFKVRRVRGECFV